MTAAQIRSRLSSFVRLAAAAAAVFWLGSVAAVLAQISG